MKVRKKLLFISTTFQVLLLKLWTSNWLGTFALNQSATISLHEYFIYVPICTKYLSTNIFSTNPQHKVNNRSISMGLKTASMNDSLSGTLLTIILMNMSISIYKYNKFWHGCLRKTKANWFLTFSEDFFLYFPSCSFPPIKGRIFASAFPLSSIALSGPIEYIGRCIN